MEERPVIITRAGRWLRVVCGLHQQSQTVGVAVETDDRVEMGSSAVHKERAKIDTRVAEALGADCQSADRTCQ